ncbi:hypothetical protein MNBD_GAMMA23-2260 [hydrothermal vent metagenome]|uniref:ATP-grasp domain-containing protein n=1 Tax=hydrothermal vent metagenome TaxID=652676 RepID=A0A3B1A8X9_9ZZZZ
MSVVIPERHQLMPLQRPPSILLIAPHGSYRTMRYLQAASRLGLHVVIISEGEHSIVSAYAQGLHVHLDQQEEALQTILTCTANMDVLAVIGTDDSVIELAAKVAQQLGLAHNNVNTARLARRKDLARKALQDKSIPVPKYQCVELEAIFNQIDIKIDFPLVIKPLALSASRGVIRVNNKDELTVAAKRIKNLLAKYTDLECVEKEQVLLEEYIHGSEIAVEGIVDKGVFKLLTIFDKPDDLHGPFFEETYYITPTRLSAEQVNVVSKVVQQACEAYGVKTGPVHAECRIRGTEIYLIEMAARTIGGLCSDILEYGLGCSLEEIVLNQATGQPVEKSFSETAAGVMMIPVPKQGILKRIEGLLEAGKIEFIEDINIQLRDGYELTPLPEGNSYLGFIFAKAPKFEQVEQALRDAYACLNVVVAPLWKIAEIESQTVRNSNE